ncbi:MAG TPA: hypothetical protein PLD62_07940 [Candidatus Cloacimonadota bacterium]|nr:hypothetical protein [Candidatus Cloacimonadota bacterium]
MKKIVFVLVLLVIILAVLLWLRSSEQISPNLLLIRYQRIDFILNSDELQNITKDDFKTKQGADFQGWKIRDILQQHGIDKFAYLIFHSADGGSLRLPAEETENAYFIEMKDAPSLSFRLILPYDEFKQRWLKFVNRIEVE